MRFRFIGSGDKRSDPDQITAFGYTFGLNGDPVEVSDDHAIHKFSGNPNFEAVEAEQAPKRKRGRPKKAVPADDGAIADNSGQIDDGHTNAD